MKSSIKLSITILLSFIGCNQSPSFQNKNTTVLIDTFQKATKFIANNDALDFSLASNIESIDLSQFELYGKFFNDRVEFYTSNNTRTNILNSRVEQITLYFIDGVLAKSKYILSENISSNLINTYGKFKFIPLNWKNRDIAKAEHIVEKNANKYQINSNLDSYQLKWNFNNRSIIYSNKDSFELQPNNYEYSEKLNNYKDVFLQIQRLEASL